MDDLTGLNQLLSLTQEMLTQSKSENWDGVIELQKNRLKLMEDCFPLDKSVDPHTAESSLKQIVALEEEITALIRANQQTMRDELGKIGQGRQATKAYKNVSGG